MCSSTARIQRGQPLQYDNVMAVIRRCYQCCFCLSLFCCCRCSCCCRLSLLRLPLGCCCRCCCCCPLSVLLLSLLLLVLLVLPPLLLLPSLSRAAHPSGRAPACAQLHARRGGGQDGPPIQTRVLTLCFVWRQPSNRLTSNPARC